jgi:hypothetical protein
MTNFYFSPHTQFIYLFHINMANAQLYVGSPFSVNLLYQFSYCYRIPVYSVFTFPSHLLSDCPGGLFLSCFPNDISLHLFPHAFYILTTSPSSVSRLFRENVGASRSQNTWASTACYRDRYSLYVQTLMPAELWAIFECDWLLVRASHVINSQEKLS